MTIQYPFYLLSTSPSRTAVYNKTLAINRSKPHPQENLHLPLPPLTIPNAPQPSPASNHMMGLDQTSNSPFISLLVFLILFFSTFIFHSSSGSVDSEEALQYPDPPGAAPSQLVSRHRRQQQEQVFHVRKSSPPPFLKNRRKRTPKRKRRSEDYKMKPGPFAVMLPKGGVPPSGSSSCHNKDPDSVAVFCSLSSPGHSGQPAP